MIRYVVSCVSKFNATLAGSSVTIVSYPAAMLGTGFRAVATLSTLDLSGVLQSEIYPFDTRPMPPLIETSQAQLCRIR